MLVVDDPSGLEPIKLPGVPISSLPVQPARPTVLATIPYAPSGAVLNMPPQLTFGSSADVRSGQELIAFGFPQGDLAESTGASQPAIITGHVAASGAAWQQHPSLLRFAGLSGPGYAGGPVINRRGDVIGITTFATLQGEGIAYAIGIDYVLAVAEQLLQGINPHWTGLSLENRRLLLGNRLVVVDEVQAGSPAALAGVQAGDTLLSLNGEAVATVGEVCTDLRQRTDGDQLTLTVRRTSGLERSTQELTFTLTLGRP